MTIALPWFGWLFAGRRGYRALGSVLVATAVGISGVAIYNTSQGGGGASAATFSGTFDCYDAATCPSNELPTPAACTRTVTPANLQSDLANTAVGGDVVCVSSGSVGDMTLNETYSSMVTVQPASGASVSTGYLDLTVDNITFTGAGGGSSSLNVGGADIQSGASSITIKYANFTSCVQAGYYGDTFNDILLDHDRFDNLGGNGASAHCGDEGRIQNRGGAASGTSLTVSNSHFGGEGPGGTCSDGIQAQSNTRSVYGPGNEFTGIDQDPCSDGTHADPIQLLYSGAVYDTIVGNWFHDNGAGSGGCMCHDGDPGPDNVTVKNNIFASGGYPYSILTGSHESNWVVSHNVFFQNVNWDYNSANSGSNIARDNVWVSGGGSDIYGSGVTEDHNLNSGKSGTGNITGTQVFVSSPASGYYHYELDSTSPGYHAGNSGNSMGICPVCG